ncbi:MAG: chemotaxis protein CheW [Desulfobacterales bacterium]|jgi:purine-binding chemotaxis protein CheW|nr:chemotaxis protein CheW [Desulfobacterales bacterium]
MKKKSTSKTGLLEREILQLRARLLADKKAPEADTSDHIKVVAFRLAAEIYGIELRHIRIVYPLKGLTQIPGIPRFISGIINMRGEIISVVDLKKLFDLHDTGPPPHRQVIILSSPEMELGIEADSVLGVMKLRKDEIQPTLPTLSGIRARYLKGVGFEGMVVLDGEKILTDQNMIIHLEEEK